MTPVDIFDSKQVIEPAWGISIRELTRHAQNLKVPQIDSDFVPFDGALENIDSELRVNTLCYELARAVGGFLAFRRATGVVSSVGCFVFGRCVESCYTALHDRETFLLTLIPPA